MGFGSVPVEIISWPNGNGLSADFSVSALLESDTAYPSFTRAAALFRLAGVMRLAVPNWSSLPQRPQLDKSCIQRSRVAGSTRCWAGAAITLRHRVKRPVLDAIAEQV